MPHLLSDEVDHLTLRLTVEYLVLIDLRLLSAEYMVDQYQRDF